jgi:hypothetical protein
MSGKYYDGKSYHEMTSQERFDRVVKRGEDPFREGSGFCRDCGYYPAFQPRVMIANLVAMTADKHLLELPPYCDGCLKKHGLTRYSFLVPKPEKIHGWQEAWDAFMQVYPAWTKHLQDKTIQDLMAKYSISEQEAKEMLGVG